MDGGRKIMSEGSTTPRPQPVAAVGDRRRSATAVSHTTESADEGVPQRAYERPRLERLGRFQALTLQQSVPIGPGSFLLGGKSPLA
jgi:hypothetical protein